MVARNGSAAHAALLCLNKAAFARPEGRASSSSGDPTFANGRQIWATGERLCRSQAPQDRFAEAAAEGELRPVAQQDGVVAVERGLQRLDAVNVHQRRAVYAQELTRSQAAFQCRDGFAQDVGHVADVQADVVSCR